MQRFIAKVSHRDTGKDDRLIREASNERELRDALSDEGLVVRSVVPVDFSNKDPRFEIQSLNGRISGPFGSGKLRAMVLDGSLLPGYLVRRTGDLEPHQWRAAWKVKGLFSEDVVNKIQHATKRASNSGWFYKIQDSAVGPVPIDILQQMTATGSIPSDTLIQYESGHWFRACDIEGFEFGTVKNNGMIPLSEQPHDPAVLTSNENNDAGKMNSPLDMENDTAAKLRYCKAMVDEGLLTEEEFAEKKRQILGLPDSSRPRSGKGPALSSIKRKSGAREPEQEPSETLGWVLVSIPFVGAILAWTIGGSLPLAGSPTPEVFLVGLLVVVILTTSILVAIDASNLGMGGTGEDGKRTWQPGEWLVGCLLLWIGVYPSYLQRRKLHGVESRFLIGIIGAIVYLIIHIYMFSLVQQTRINISSDLMRLFSY